MPTLYKSSNLSSQLLTFVALLPQKLKPGSLVLLRNSARDGRKGDKFQAWYLGPYKTVGTVREERFQTAQPATCLLLIKSVNACHLKLYRNWQWPLLHQNNTSLPGKKLSSDILLTAFGLVQYILSIIIHLSVSDWIPWLKLEHHKAKWKTTTSFTIWHWSWATIRQKAKRTTSIGIHV